MTNIPMKSPGKGMSNNNLQTFAGKSTINIANVLKVYESALSDLFKNDKFRALKTIQTMATIVKNNPKLGNCSIQSIVGGMLYSAILGLDFSPQLGNCYLIPYGADAQFQLGYRGLIQIIYRNPQIIDVYSENIYLADEYDIAYGTDRHLFHKPNFEDKALRTPSNIILTYAVAKTARGGYLFNIIESDEMERIRQTSPNQGKVKSGVWLNWETEMRKAKALKRLCKTLPFSNDFDQSQLDDEIIVKGTSPDKLDIKSVFDSEIEPKSEPDEKPIETNQTEPPEVKISLEDEAELFKSLQEERQELENGK